MNWRKPKSCSLNDVCLEVAPCDCGHCLEVSTDVPGLAPGDLAIRESERPNALVVTSRANFAAFVAACAAGEYTDLCGVSDAGR